MKIWFVLLLCLAVPLTSAAADHVIAWTYVTQPQDRDFVVERCRNRAAGCVMSRIATVSRTVRHYTDRGIQRRASYCYQVGVRDPHGVYQWSNIVCGS